MGGIYAVLSPNCFSPKPRCFFLRLNVEYMFYNDFANSEIVVVCTSLHTDYIDIPYKTLSWRQRSDSRFTAWHAIGGLSGRPPRSLGFQYEPAASRVRVVPFQQGNHKLHKLCYVHGQLILTKNFRCIMVVFCRYIIMTFIGWHWAYILTKCHSRITMNECKHSWMSWKQGQRKSNWVRKPST